MKVTNVKITVHKTNNKLLHTSYFRCLLEKINKTKTVDFIQARTNNNC